MDRTFTTVRNMLHAIEAPLYDVGVLSDRGGCFPELGVIPAVAVIARLSLLKYRNARGSHIYLRPSGEHRYTVFDDLSEVALRQVPEPARCGRHRLLRRRLRHQHERRPDRTSPRRQLPLQRSQPLRRAAYICRTMVKAKDWANRLPAQWLLLTACLRHSSFVVRAKCSMHMRRDYVRVTNSAPDKVAAEQNLETSQRSIRSGGSIDDRLP